MSMKSLSKLAVMVGVLLALNATAETIITNEFWICNSTNTANLGTLDNPYDGSTQAKFDMVMSNMPPNATIHILAGTYETWGSYNWFIKTGQKIIGSGRDNTILQFPPGTPEYGAGNFIIYSYYILTNSEVADLTCDCNWNGGGYTYSGVGLNGTGNIVRRVRVIHCGYTSGVNSEAWGIAVGNGSIPTSQGNIIEDCEVSEFAGGHNITAISESGSWTNYCSGIMRNNVVLLSPDPVGAQFAFGSGAWGSDILIEGNYVNGADDAVYGDTGGTTNLIIAHNFFNNCFQAINWDNAVRYNITVEFNNISLTPRSGIVDAAFNFWGGSVLGGFTNVIIFGNTIGFYDSPSNNVMAIITGQDPVTGLVFANNTVDPLIGSNQATYSIYFTNVSNANMYNNTDMYGNYVPSLNIPTLGGVPVTSFGLNLVSSAEASSALTNLGLPSNPANVVTNNETGVTLSGTFSGNGSGLTGLNWSDITGVPSFAQYSDPAPTFTNGMNIGAETAYQIGGNDILWSSNSPGVGFDLILGLEPAGVVPIGLGNLLEGAYNLPYATNAYYNTIIGTSAGRFLLSSQNNTLVGANAGQALQYGNDNTFLGYNSGFGNTSFTNGYQNTSIGDQSLYRARSGTNNVALGYFAGSWLYSGNNNVFIAHQGTSVETNSNGTIYIGDLGVQNTTYIAGTVYSGNGFIGNSLVATNGFQCATNYVPSTWAPVPGSVILRASNDWMYAISMHSTNAAFKIGP